MRKDVILICTVTMLISLSIPNVMAQPPLPPCIFYGYVKYITGKPAADGLNVTATIAGTTLKWETATKNGTYGWPAKGSIFLEIPSNDPETPEKDGGRTGDSIEFYVGGIKIDQTATFESGGAERIDLTIPQIPEEEYVVIDQAFVSDQRADVQSFQTVGFHAAWGLNGSDVIGGIIKIESEEYLTNATGWANVNVSSSMIEKEEWVVDGVNCGGVTTHVQITPNPSIVWDEIMIVDGGITRESIVLGETATVWFRAVYEYDDVVFDNTKGTLYMNGSALSWSMTNNRWEHNYTATTSGTEAFTITGVSDSSYGLTAINDTVGVKIITVSENQSTPDPYLLYAIVIVIVIGASSFAVFRTHRKGYRIVLKKPKK